MILVDDVDEKYKPEDVKYRSEGVLRLNSLSSAVIVSSVNSVWVGDPAMMHAGCETIFLRDEIHG